MSDQERYIQSLKRKNAYLKIKRHGLRLLLEEAYTMANSGYVDTDTVMPEAREHGTDNVLRIKKDLLNSIYGVMMADPEPEPVVRSRDELVKALYACGRSDGCAGEECPFWMHDREKCYNDIRLLAAYMLEHRLDGLSQEQIEEALSNGNT